jgi:hypothetical protein
VDAHEIVRYLNPEADERAVLSVIFRKSGGILTLTAASLLIGPRAMAESSWPTWRRESGRRSGVDFVKAEFVHDLAEWVVGRAIVDIADVVGWIESSLAGRCLSIGPIPEATASLGAAESPIQVFEGVDSPTTQFICGSVRPVRGFHFPNRDNDDTPQGLDREWHLDEQKIFNAPYELLGIFVAKDAESVPSPAGLFVGRLQRRAWLIEVRGGDELETFEVHVGLDPERVDIADLEIEYEETLRSDVVLNQRVRLEDVDLASVRGAPAVRVDLPTMGTKVAHAVRLHDRDGVLLDMTDPHYLVESIGITLVAGGHESEIVVGKRRPTPTLVERAERVDHVIEQFRAWFERGLDGKVFDKDEDSRTALLAHLRSSRGPLMVLDAWFGKRQVDWDLIRQSDRDKRLLIGEKAAARNPPPFPPIERLEVRVWKSSSGKNPFHDRFYLWDEGGLHVGTSPDGFGGRLFRMQRIGKVEANGLRTRFEDWWGSESVRPF